MFELNTTGTYGSLVKIVLSIDKQTSVVTHNLKISNMQNMF